MPTPTFYPPILGPLTTIPKKRSNRKPFRGYWHELLKSVPINCGFVLTERQRHIQSMAAQFGMKYAQRTLAPSIYIYIRLA